VVAKTLLILFPEDGFKTLSRLSVITKSPEIRTLLLPQPYGHSILDNTLVYALYKYIFTSHFPLPDPCKAAEVELHTTALKIATALFARPLDNFQNSTRLIPKNQNNTNDYVFVS
jgi:hypothetical protein